MKWQHGFLYGLLMLGLTACPFLDSPAPIEPLAQEKTGKQSYKSRVCRPIQVSSADGVYRYTFQYDKEGRISSVLHHNTGRTHTYHYDKRGHLEAVLSGLPGYDISLFFYSDNNMSQRTVRRGQAFADDNFYYDNNVLKGCFFGADRFNSWCNVNQFGIIEALVFGNRKTSYTYDGGNTRAYRNVTYVENRINDQINAFWQYEFDNHPSPLSLVQFKDVPQSADLYSRDPQANDKNNPTKEAYKKIDLFGRILESYDVTYTYTYNSAGYPTKVTKTYTDGRVVSWTNTYEGCQ